MGSMTEHPLNGSSNDPSEYVISWDRVHSQPDRLRVICVGAGASGLYLAYRMKKTMTTGTWELICYEKNASIGGTWYENRYPGVACDIPAHNYTYSHRPNPLWSTFYAKSPEILKYFENFRKDENLDEYVQLNTKVVSAVWDAGKGIYNVEVESHGQLKQDWCHVLVNASGNLNKWKWPEINGLHSFGGQLIHSANWPDDNKVILAGKRVAVIGTGSSAIQIIPKIQPEVSQLTAFIRSATWISPAVGQEVVGRLLGKDTTANPLRHAQHEFTNAEKDRFLQDPEYHRQFRHEMESKMNNSTPAFIKGTDMNTNFQKFMTAEMEKRIGEGHEELKKKLIPTWAPGCRRLTPGDGYLEALVKDNVSPVFDEITEITEKGLKTESGDLHEVDIIICATGFDVRFVPGFSLTGLDGKSIQKDWAQEPNCYLGIAAPHFPNYFIVLGPRGPWGNGPLLASLETMCDHFVEVMRKMQKERIKSLEVKLEPTIKFNQHVSSWHRGTGAPSPWGGSVWNGGCKSWYKMGSQNGEVWLWPGGTPSYLATIKHPRFEDYNIQYKSNNEWSFLGNGMILAEKLNGEVAPYIRNSDTPWTIGDSESII